MKTNQSSNVTFITSVARLEARLDFCGGSEEYVEVIHALVATGKKGAVRVLASLLDSTGPIAEESIKGLITLATDAGLDVAPAMKKCTGSDDYEMIRHAHRVLIALGSEESREWLRADDAERIEAYLDKQGFTDEDDRVWAKLEAGIANDADEEDGVA